MTSQNSVVLQDVSKLKKSLHCSTCCDIKYLKNRLLSKILRESLHDELKIMQSISFFSRDKRRNNKKQMLTKYFFSMLFNLGCSYSEFLQLLWNKHYAHYWQLNAILINDPFCYLDTLKKIIIKKRQLKYFFRSNTKIST